MKNLSEFLTISESRSFNIPKAAVKEICNGIYDLVRESDIIAALQFQHGWWSPSNIEWLMGNDRCPLGSNLIMMDTDPKDFKNKKLKGKYVTIEFEPDPNRRDEWRPVLIPNHDAILKTLEMYGGGSLETGADAVGNIVEIGDEVICASPQVCRTGKLIRAVVKKITNTGKISTDQGIFDAPLCVVITRNGRSVGF